MAFLQVNFFSNVLGLNMDMNVILPQKTKGKLGIDYSSPGETYKTLYLLHGMSDNHTIWQRYTSIERYANDNGIAVVMPTTHLAWYSDTKYGMKYLEFISEELPKICGEFFQGMSKDREDTFIAGLSMGGYGALKIGLLNPETFGAVASLSGALDVASEKQIQLMSQNRPYWEGIFGPLEEIKNSNNDIFYLAQEIVKTKKPIPKIFMWCGEEDFLYPQNERAYKHFTNLNIEVTYSHSQGSHSWKHWDIQIQNVLKWLDLVK